MSLGDRFPGGLSPEAVRERLGSPGGCEGSPYGGTTSTDSGSPSSALLSPFLLLGSPSPDPAAAPEAPSSPCVGAQEEVRAYEECASEWQRRNQALTSACQKLREVETEIASLSQKLFSQKQELDTQKKVMRAFRTVLSGGSVPSKKKSAFIPFRQGEYPGLEETKIILANLAFSQIQEAVTKTEAALTRAREAEKAARKGEREARNAYNSACFAYHRAEMAMPGQTGASERGCK